jgi:hypothetical protein
MSKPVNLRRARKQKARAEKAKQAQSNRMAHGQPKSAIQIAKVKAEKAARDLDGKKRHTADRPPSDD